MGCCGSKKRYDRLPVELESVEIQPDSGPRPYFQSAVEDADETDACTSHKTEEREFFQVLFSALDRSPAYQGVLRRWEKEAQRADCDSGGRYLLQKVWADGVAYTATLERVRQLSSMKSFDRSTRMRMAKLSAAVAKRRSREYNKARHQGRADYNHKLVLDQWKKVAEMLR